LQIALAHINTIDARLKPKKLVWNCTRTSVKNTIFLIHEGHEDHEDGVLEHIAAEAIAIPSATA